MGPSTAPRYFIEVITMDVRSYSSSSVYRNPHQEVLFPFDPYIGTCHSLGQAPNLTLGVCRIDTVPHLSISNACFLSSKLLSEGLPKETEALYGTASQLKLIQSCMLNFDCADLQAILYVPWRAAG